MASLRPAQPCQWRPDFAGSSNDRLPDCLHTASISNTRTAIYHDALVQAWAEANAWMVGAYVIMPDHIHLFCAPKNEEIAIEQWIAFRKRQFRRKVGPAAPRFQSRGFHHRLRRDENYHQKWEYVRSNPVRAGLVKNAEEWKYRGVLNHLPWYGVRRRSSKRFVGSTESRPTSISTAP